LKRRQMSALDQYGLCAYDGRGSGGRARLGVRRNHWAGNVREAAPCPQHRPDVARHWDGRLRRYRRSRAAPEAMTIRVRP